MKALVLALGNDILGDDAVGFLVADKLEELLSDELRSRVDIVKSSQAGFYLLDYFLMGHDRVIVIDSIIGSKPGEIVEIDLEDLRPALAPSPHYSGLPEILSLLENLDSPTPDVEIYAITINEPHIGTDISEPVKEASEKLARMLNERLRELLSGTP